MAPDQTPDRCPDCDRQLVKENGFVLCSQCEFIIDLQEDTDGRED